MHDPRLATLGKEIPSLGYCDQPYLTETADGAWLCVLCTGPGHEGQRGQTVAVTRSVDQGESWSPLVLLEPVDGPEASYAVVLTAPNGRVFVFYNHNTEDVRSVIADAGEPLHGRCDRVDSLGHFVFKYSDDHGVTWSDDRYEVPQRLFAIDRDNPYAGELLFFWTVGRAFVHDHKAYVPLSKVGGFGEGFFTRSEGVLLCSDNLLDEPDPKAIRWQTLPDGDIGLRAPAGGGPIAEEQSFVVLSDGSLFGTWRTIDGSPACAYSRDGGHSWSAPRYMCYADGSQMRHSRAANFPWRCSNGHYLYWFGNNATNWYQNPDPNRNPAWLAGAIERDGPEGKELVWSQPEVALYLDEWASGMSYPDFMEADGKYFITETQKVVARLHQIPNKLVEGLWQQLNDPQSLIAELEPIVAWGPCGDGDPGALVDRPTLPVFCVRERNEQPDGSASFCLKNQRTGVTLVVDGLSAQQGLVLDGRDAAGRGLSLTFTEDARLEVQLCDGHVDNRWACDADCFADGQAHHLVLIIDAGPRLIQFVVDGKLCDGAGLRPYGWGRFSAQMTRLDWADQWQFPQGRESLWQVFDRALSVSEAHACCKGAALQSGQASCV